MELTAGKLLSLRRMADRNGIFKMVAADQRPPIMQPIAEKLGVSKAPWKEVARFKGMLVDIMQNDSTAFLLDPFYALPASLDILSPQKGLVITLEDSNFIEYDGGRLSKDIDNWSVGKIKRIGGHAVKVLAWYRPDASPEVVQAQKDYVRKVGEDCAYFDIPFLLELLVYPLKQDAVQTKEYVEMTNKRTDDVLKSVEEFAKPEYGVDIFKLESPVNAKDADGSARVQTIFDEMARIAGRPFVMLSAGASKEQFLAVLGHAFKAGASGFLAGRSIWLEAFNHYPNWNRIEAELKSEASIYLKKISELADNCAMNWRTHNCYGTLGAKTQPVSSDFHRQYAKV